MEKKVLFFLLFYAWQSVFTGPRHTKNIFDLDFDFLKTRIYYCETCKFIAIDHALQTLMQLFRSLTRVA